METEERIPRLLPCTHTVCGSCIVLKLFRENSLDCPVCGINHEFIGIECIPENKYILKYIDEKRVEQETKRQCSQHERELNLFCNEPDCQISICLLCLKDDHMNHDWDYLQHVEEKQHQILIKELDSFKTYLKENREMLLQVREENDHRVKACVKQVEEERKEQLKKLNETFDNIRMEINSRKIHVDTRIDDAVAKINGGILETSNVEENFSEAVSGASDKLKTVNNLKAGVQDTLSKLIQCKYCEYAKSKATGMNVQSLCGNLVQKDFQVFAKLTHNGNERQTEEEMVDVQTEDENASCTKKRRFDAASRRRNTSKISYEGLFTKT